MPYFHVFLWDGLNDEHIAEHGVTKEEFEEVVLAARQRDVEQSRGSDRLVVIGETAAGRRIFCAYESIDDIYCFPVTAYEV
jgi:uncharacterized DUF497 family protein